MAHSTLADRDLFYRCAPGDASNGILARQCPRPSRSRDRARSAIRERVLRLRGAVPRTPLVMRFRDLAGTGGHVALCIDDTERSGEEGAALLARGGPSASRALSPRVLGSTSAEVRTSPARRRWRCHPSGPDPICASTKRTCRTSAGPDLAGLLSDPELASWPALASLMLQGHNDLIVDYIIESVLPESTFLWSRGLAALVAVGGVPVLSSSQCCSPSSAFRCMLPSPFPASTSVGSGPQSSVFLSSPPMTAAGRT